MRDRTDRPQEHLPAAGAGQPGAHGPVIPDSGVERASRNAVTEVDDVETGAVEDVGGHPLADGMTLSLSLSLSPVRPAAPSLAPPAARAEQIEQAHNRPRSNPGSEMLVGDGEFAPGPQAAHCHKGRRDDLVVDLGRRDGGAHGLVDHLGGYACAAGASASA